MTGALCSSLAGVYFEKILKGAGQPAAPPLSLWARNFQLSLCSLLIGARRARAPSPSRLVNWFLATEGCL